MSQKTPIVLNDDKNKHIPLASTDTLSVDSIPVSAESGNNISKRDDGLYMGTTAPADVRALYVSTTLGSDTNAGTRDAPLQTLSAALAKHTDNGYLYTVYLRAGETFTLDTIFSRPTASLVIRPYDYTEEQYESLGCSHYEPTAIATFNKVTLQVPAYAGAVSTDGGYDYNYCWVDYALVRLYATNLTLLSQSITANDTFSSSGVFRGYTLDLHYVALDMSAVPAETRLCECTDVRLVCGEYTLGTYGRLGNGENNPSISFSAYVGTPSGCPDIGVPAYEPVNNNRDTIVAPFTPANIVYYSSYDVDSKRFFNAVIGWDIFANLGDA